MQPPDQLRRFFQLSDRPIILIGASVRAAACSAGLAGFDVLGIDRFADSDTIDACSAFLTIEQADQLSDDDLDDLIPPGVPMLVVGGLLGDTTIIDRLKTRAHWMGRQEQALDLLSQPETLARIATRSRVPFPSYRLPSDRGGSLGQLPGRWLFKTQDSSGGLGVRWVDADKDVDSDGYAQRWVAGKPYGAVFVSNGEHDCVLIGVSRSLRKRMGDCPFVYAGSCGPVRLSAQNIAKLNSIANLCVAETGYSGFLNIDVVIDQQGQMSLLEVNPRWSASVEVLEVPLLGTRFLKRGFKTLFGVMLTAIEGDISKVSAKQIEELAYETGRCYKRVVFARHEGRIDQTLMPRMGKFRWQFADVPQDDEQLFQKDDPICTVLLRSGSDRKFDWRKTKRLLAGVQEAVVES